MNSLGQLRQLRHQQWLAQLRRGLEALVQADEHGDRQRPDQIYLFGSRARGDWDGLSDTDLLVVAATQAGADDWANRVMESGLAEVDLSDTLLALQPFAVEARYRDGEFPLPARRELS